MHHKYNIVGPTRRQTGSVSSKLRKRLEPHRTRLFPVTSVRIRKRCELNHQRAAMADESAAAPLRLVNFVSEEQVILRSTP